MKIFLTNNLTYIQLSHGTLFSHFLETHIGALMWHPDRHATKNEEQKNYAERMFKDVGEAFEVCVFPSIDLYIEREIERD